LISLVTLIVYLRGEVGFEQAFRDSAFQVVAIVTTTGFGTADFTAWGPFLLVLFFVLMFSGACAGSTSGGIKVARSIVVFKNSYLELKRQIHPKAILPVRLNGSAIQAEVVGKIVVFFLIFILLFILGAFVMSFLVKDFDTALGSVAATLGNIGPGIGAVGPADPENFAAIPDLGKWFLSFLMLLGRLELFTVLMILTPFFWKER
ncbi:MAG: potassium transporter TrkG, partial [Bacteroidota bacterium]